MLESLEKLRGGHFGDRGISSSFHDAYVLANDIQAEVDEKYIPRDEVNKHYCHNPLFDDGETVQVGDYVDLQMEGKRRVQVTDIQPWIVYGDSTSHQNEPYKRPPEPDSQEKIDEDLTLAARDYCNKRGLNADYDSDMAVEYYPEIVTRMDLLARQRKLDGVE